MIYLFLLYSLAPRVRSYMWWLTIHRCPRWYYIFSIWATMLLYLLYPIFDYWLSSTATLTTFNYNYQLLTHFLLRSFFICILLFFPSPFTFNRLPDQIRYFINWILSNKDSLLRKTCSAWILIMIECTKQLFYNDV